VTICGAPEGGRRHRDRCAATPVGDLDGLGSGERCGAREQLGAQTHAIGGDRPRLGSVRIPLLEPARDTGRHQLQLAADPTIRLPEADDLVQVLRPRGEVPGVRPLDGVHKGLSVGNVSPVREHLDLSVVQIVQGDDPERAFGRAVPVLSGRRCRKRQDTLAHLEIGFRSPGLHATAQQNVGPRHRDRQFLTQSAHRPLQVLGIP